MKKKLLLVVAVVVAVALFAGAFVLYNQLKDTVQLSTLGETAEMSSGMSSGTSSGTESDSASSQSQTQAPDFTVTDAQGNEVSLSSYFGKPIVLNFWASWCGPCKSEMPDFEEAYQTYGDEIHFVMVNMTDGSRETQEAASSFVQQQGFTFPVLYDTQMNAATTYSVWSLPTTYFIDEEGYLVAQGRGALDRETLEKGIGMIHQTGN